MIPDRNYDSLGYSGTPMEKFRVQVTRVDHNETLDDKNEYAKLYPIQSGESKRNLHIAGLRVDGLGNPLVDIVVGQSSPGNFKLPQQGDIVWVEMDPRGQRSKQARYLGFDYNDTSDTTDYSMPVPIWGSQQGDYGDLRSYRDHAAQWSPKLLQNKLEIVPRKPANFFTKYVRSITGYRWRHFKRSNLLKDMYVIRGDGVFDLDLENMKKREIIEDGLDMIKGSTIDDRQWRYPNPMNVPEKREEDKNFHYIYRVHQFLPESLLVEDPFKEDEMGRLKREFEEYILKNKNFFSYEPISDKSYLKKTAGKFERELIATEEYTLALRGNNKLSIIDHYGDGEQITLVLKNQYDAGIAIVHNRELSQVRIRDHLGQSILIEANEEKPRIIATTFNRQVIEAGSVKGKGAFIYLRNGEAFGNSDVPWGRKTNRGKSTVFNQEFLMVENDAMFGHGEFLNRLSIGMQTLLQGKGPGIFHRTVDDAESKYNKTYATWEKDDIIYEERVQHWIPNNTWVREQIEVHAGQERWTLEGVWEGRLINKFHFDNEKLKVNRNHSKSGVPLSHFLLNDEVAELTGYDDVPTKIGTDSNIIEIGNSRAVVNIQGAYVGVTPLPDPAPPGTSIYSGEVRERKPRDPNPPKTASGKDPEP